MSTTVSAGLAHPNVGTWSCVRPAGFGLGVRYFRSLSAANISRLLKAANRLPISSTLPVPSKANSFRVASDSRFLRYEIQRAPMFAKNNQTKKKKPKNFDAAEKF